MNCYRISPLSLGQTGSHGAGGKDNQTSFAPDWYRESWESIKSFRGGSQEIIKVKHVFPSQKNEIHPKDHLRITGPFNARVNEAVFRRGVVGSSK